MNPLSAYKINLSVLIKKYADPVHDDGVTINDLHDMFIPSLLEVIKENKDKEKTLCTMSPIIEWIQIADQYPEEPKEYGGGDGGKERFSLSVKINLTTIIKAKKNLKVGEVESLVNELIEDIYENECELMQYACDFSFLGMNSYEQVK